MCYVVTGTVPVIDLYRYRTCYGPFFSRDRAASVSSPLSASVVPIAAAVSPDAFASAPTATATTTPSAALAHHIDAPIDAPPHAVPGPSKLWPDAALVLVTAAVARALVATFDSAASTRSGAIPAASMVCADGASAAPVHCAALHRGQRQRRSRVALHATCAHPPP